MSIDASSVEALLAKEAIRDLLYRYCRAIDRCDEALLEEIYHSAATDDHALPGLGGSAAEFREVVIGLLRDKWESTQHVLGNILIELAGDVAYSEAYVIAYHLRKRGDDGVQLKDVF